MDLDGRLYRAVVLEVRYEGCTLQFVDYCTVEVFMVEDTREDLFITEIPRQLFGGAPESISSGDMTDARKLIQTLIQRSQKSS